MKFKLFVLFSSIVLLIACGKSAPKCDDDDVKKLAIQTAIKSYLNQAKFSDKITMLKYLRGDNDAFKNANTFEDAMVNSIGGFATAFGDSESDSLFSVPIDSAYQAGAITLDAIRVKEISDELKKCGCEANINFKQIYYEISYSAQYTEDNRVYVESELRSAKQ